MDDRVKVLIIILSIAINQNWVLTVSLEESFEGIGV